MRLVKSLPCLFLSLALAAAAPTWAQTSAGKSDGSPGVVEKVEQAVVRGAQAAASGVERGAQAAASGVQRGARAAAHRGHHRPGTVRRCRRRAASARYSP